MDLKTLEYMENRASKARKIVKEIDRLTENIDSISKIQNVRFINHNWSSQFDSSTGELTDLLKEAYVKAASEKIQKLEEKLSEL